MKENEILNQLIEYFNNTPRDVIEKEWHEYDKFNEIGPKVNDFLGFINSLRKPQYPTTFEECLNVLGMNLDSVLDTPYENGTRKYVPELWNFYRLLICRDAYWKLVGDWKPDVNNTDEYFFIVNRCGHVVKVHYMSYNYILAFPTEEMRDAFYENFKELINETKELL